MECKQPTMENPLRELQTLGQSVWLDQLDRDMILSGELSIHLEGPTSERVATLGPGETVGELSVIDQSPAWAYVVAKREYDDEDAH